MVRHACCFGPALALALSAGAAAQCIWSVQDVPDFDQRRVAATGIPGLPGNGGMYCAPVSVLNWFAYFANRGAPQPATLAGPRNWIATAQYNHVTNNMALMGQLMNTDASGGTGGNGMLTGTVSWGLISAPGKFIVTHKWGAISPNYLSVVHTLGGYTAGCYGRYTQNGSTFTRTGGHCVTIIGMIDTGCNNDGVVMYRDPASDGANSTQSPFATTFAQMTAVSGNFGGGSETRYKLEIGSPPSVRVLDGAVNLYPQFALTAAPTFINIHTPFNVQFATAIPAVQTFNKPANTGNILAATLHPFEHKPFVLMAGPPGPTVQPEAIWSLDRSTGGWTSLIQGNDLHQLCFNRFFDLYVADGSVIRRYDVSVVPPVLLGSYTAPARPDSIAWDSRLDQLVVLTNVAAVGGPRQLVRLNRALGAPIVEALPVSITGDGSVAPDPTAPQSYWVCADGSRTIYRLVSNTDTLSVAESFVVPAPNDPKHLNALPDGHLLFSLNNMTQEWARPAGGTWGPVPSAFAGLSIGAGFQMAQSSTNHDPAVHEGPGWVNLPDPDVVPGTPDCFANCDGSTVAPVLNALDFQCYLNKFRNGQIEADCDGSTAAPILNALDFSCFLTRFQQGCP